MRTTLSQRRHLLNLSTRLEEQLERANRFWSCCAQSQSFFHETKKTPEGTNREVGKNSGWFPLFRDSLECPWSVSEAVGYDVPWETPTRPDSTVTVIVTPTLQTSTAILLVALATPITEQTLTTRTNSERDYSNNTAAVRPVCHVLCSRNWSVRQRLQLNTTHPRATTQSALAAARRTTATGSVIVG